MITGTIMHLTEYLLYRSITWYKDTFQNQFNNEENLPPNFDKFYIEEKLRECLYLTLHYSDFRDNTITIKLYEFNVWLKVSYYSDLKIEFIAYENEEEKLVFNSEKINNSLFYKYITKPFEEKYSFNLKKERTFWQKRERNQYLIYDLLNRYLDLDISTFKAKKSIEINIITLKEIKKQNNNFKNAKGLFFKALQYPELRHLLTNYHFFFNGFNKTEENNFFVDLLKNYSLTTNDLKDLKVEYNQDVFNNIIDHTEIGFTLPHHENSCYYEVLNKRIKNQNIYTYFMFLRLSALNKIEQLPSNLIESIDNHMLERFDKLSDILIQLFENQQVLNSFVHINNLSKSLELNGWSYGFEYEEHKKIIYQCVINAPINNNIISGSSFSQILLGLIQSNVFTVADTAECLRHIKNFHYNHNLKKIKFKNYLENKLKPKNIRKKVEKI